MGVNSGWHIGLSPVLQNGKEHMALRWKKLVRRESANMMRSAGFRRSAKPWRNFCGGCAGGLPLPTELAALCDDFISEQECAEQGESVLAVS